MGTTALYVELIVIGLEASLWMTSFAVYFTDVTYLAVVVEVLEKLPAAVLLLGGMYVVGLILDRLADLLSAPLEKRCRSKAAVKATSTILIWVKSGQEEYLKFSRSKIRILRASLLNLPLFFLSLLLNTHRYCSGSAVFWYVLVLGALLTVSAVMGYWNAVKVFYQKAAILEEALSQAQR